MLHNILLDCKTLFKISDTGQKTVLKIKGKILLSLSHVTVSYIYVESLPLGSNLCHRFSGPSPVQKPMGHNAPIVSDAFLHVYPRACLSFILAFAIISSHVVMKLLSSLQEISGRPIDSNSSSFFNKQNKVGVVWVWLYNFVSVAFLTVFIRFAVMFSGLYF